MAGSSLLSTFFVGDAHADLGVKASRPTQCWIKRVGAVCGA